MPRIADSENHRTGERIYDWTPIPLGVTQWMLRMSRESWPTKAGNTRQKRHVVFGRLEWSLDGGATVGGGGGIKSRGGDHFLMTGALSPETTRGSNIPEPNNPDRVFRVVTEVYKRIRMQIDVDFT